MNLPEDDTLVIVPPVSREHTGIWINKLITTATLCASLGVWCIFGLVVAGITVRIIVGDFTFRTNGSYLGWIVIYLAVVIAVISHWALTMELPPYVPKWQIQKEIDREDPFDPVPYDKFGR